MNRIEFDQVMADLFESRAEQPTDSFDKIFDKQIEALEAHCESEDESEEILRPLVEETDSRFDPVSSKENNIFSSQSSENKEEVELELGQSDQNSPTAETFIEELVKSIEQKRSRESLQLDETKDSTSESPKTKKRETNFLENWKIRKPRFQKRTKKEAKKLSAIQMMDLKPVFQIMTEIVLAPLFKNVVETSVKKLMNIHNDDTGTVLSNLEFLQQEINKAIGSQKKGRPRNKLQPLLDG
jgi:hypothetical protein